jgi:hypothetical protein
MLANYDSTMIYEGVFGVILAEDRFLFVFGLASELEAKVAALN